MYALAAVRRKYGSAFVIAVFLIPIFAGIPLVRAILTGRPCQ